MCHSDVNYKHPFRTVQRAALALAVAVPAALLAYAHLVVVLIALGALVLVAGVAQVADVIGTRRAVAAHEAHCAGVARARAVAALDAGHAHGHRDVGVSERGEGVLHVPAERPAALEAAAPRVDPEWLVAPTRVHVPRTAES